VKSKYSSKVVPNSEEFQQIWEESHKISNDESDNRNARRLFNNSSENSRNLIEVKVDISDKYDSDHRPIVVLAPEENVQQARSILKTLQIAEIDLHFNKLFSQLGNDEDDSDSQNEPVANYHLVLTTENRKIHSLPSDPDGEESSAFIEECEPPC